MTERSRRAAAETDAAVWRRAIAGVAPMRRRPAPAPVSLAREERRPGDPPSAPRGTAAPAVAPPPLDRFAGIDRATAERLKRGQMAIEARLDLHGMTQEEAHRALAGFIVRSRAGSRRCVLVITGRGVAGGGVLRAAVPRWLAEPPLRPHLLAIAPAQPRDGGGGALYVLLRRPGRP
jgi:DNA-nicking Smr family endonuclease